LSRVFPSASTVPTMPEIYLGEKNAEQRAPPHKINSSPHHVLVIVYKRHCEHIEHG
jgi:hypothetical protein